MSGASRSARGQGRRPFGFSETGDETHCPGRDRGHRRPAPPCPAALTPMPTAPMALMPTWTTTPTTTTSTDPSTAAIGVRATASTTMIAPAGPITGTTRITSAAAAAPDIIPSTGTPRRDAAEFVTEVARPRRRAGSSRPAVLAAGRSGTSGSMGRPPAIDRRRRTGRSPFTWAEDTHRLGEQDPLPAGQAQLLGQTRPIAVVEPSGQAIRGGEQIDVAGISPVPRNNRPSGPRGRAAPARRSRACGSGCADWRRRSAEPARWR